MTTAPEETTTRPEETTTAPVETTTVPVETTTVPVETTTVPVETTTVPVETTTVPDETTTVPVENTTVPDETTTVPDETTTAPDDSSENNNQLNVKEDSDITVYEEDKIVEISPESTCEDVLNELENNNVVILDKDGNELADDAFVGTGCKVQLIDEDGNVVSEYEVVALNDVDGNGKITAADARLALRAAAKIDIIDGVYVIAADANSDNKVTAADARIILRKAAGLK